jgi:Nif-specific regulatory protein
VACAQGGTLFLDEVAELSPRGQSKLLQFLHSRQYCSLGGAPLRKADVRILAATNVDLDEAVRERRFLEDLLYRLKGVSIRMPNLAERPEHLPLLARHFCKTAQVKYELAPVTLSESALRAIAAASWPGNVRQLAAVVELASVRAAVS